MPHRRRVLLYVPMLYSLLPLLMASAPVEARSPDPAIGSSISLQTAFRNAAREFGVPEQILLAVSYNESLWEDHGGAPSTSGGYGPMHLTHVDWVPEIGERGGLVSRPHWIPGGPPLHTLDAAARLLAERPERLKDNPLQNIRGGAALLARYAMDTVGRCSAALGEWYGAVALYSGSRYADVALDFANAVYATIRTGETRVTSGGQRVVLAPQWVAIDTRTVRPLHLQSASHTRAECPAGLACQYIPAAFALNNPRDPRDFGNYDVANRANGSPAVHYIVIHDTEVPYNAAISGFQNSTRYASSNYVIRAADGEITQMVQDKNIAWHAGNYYYNMHAIGIEHEGVAIEGARWYSEQMYRASATLVRFLANRYHVPLDRAHIIGHDQVPGMTPDGQASQHWDPGPFWDWQHYMDLLGAPVNTGFQSPDSGPITVAPDFATNQPRLTYCPSGGQCGAVAPQSANFVYLRTAPDASAPLLSDRAIHPAGDYGTDRADDWGDKAAVGEQFFRVARQGSWDKIDYGGQEAWLYDPSSNPTTVASLGSALVTPRVGLASIPVYGWPHPERSAYPSYIPKKDIPKVVPLQYSIPAGQSYVVTDQVTSDYYWSPTQTKHALVQGHAVYYEISFNHRLAFVWASDVVFSGA